MREKYRPDEPAANDEFYDALHNQPRQCERISSKITALRLLVCATESAGYQSSKKVVASLICDLGFEPVDAGPLRIARYTEPFALLNGHL